MLKAIKMARFSFWFILYLLPHVNSYDCREICNLTVYVYENTPIEDLQWNLIDLLVNRTSTRFPFEHYQYSLSNPSDYFQIDSPILKYRLQEFDREKLCNRIFFHDDECSLQLQIFTQTSFIILFKLIILDINDWKPYFENDHIHINIRENLPINYRVQLPIAFDHDSIKYNIDYYQFVHDNHLITDLFQLEKFHDELRLKLLKKLDCEQMNNYQLEIIAVDKGGLKSNILHVNVTVDDVNESQPHFKQRLYHTRIPENTPISNTSILNVIATDDDCYDKIIYYSLLLGDISNEKFPFEIDKYTGSIYVIQPLDYETTSVYRLRVKASNVDQIAWSIVPVIIDILDINDNQPMIQMNILSDYKTDDFDDENDDLMIYINENVRVGQVLGTMLIRDNDSLMINRKLSLKILSCWPTKTSCPIELDSGNGNSDENEKTLIGSTNYLIRTSRQLDTEIGDEKFTIVLEARDYGDPSLSSERRLIIVIRDQNDCVPKFSQSTYQFRFSESTPIGYPIGEIHAIDHDYSNNFRQIHYQLVSNSNNKIIEVNPTNGSIYLKEKLSAGMSFNLTVRAIDQQNQSLYDQANLEILTYDEEKCTPSFTQTLYIFNTTEHHLTPYELGKVSADSCLSSSIEVSYHFTNNGQVALLPFSIDSQTGMITVTRDLDREIKTIYKFSIDSFNHKTRQISQTEVQINILDENDHYPIFDKTLNNLHEQYVFINKSLPLIRTYRNNQTMINPIFIARISATDGDEGSNGLINYYFTNNENYAFFHLYQNGTIVLYNQNDLQLPYRLEIYARDQGNPVPYNSKETIVIYVCDVAKRDECPLDHSINYHDWNLPDSPLKLNNRLTTNFYLGSIFIMISILLFIIIIIVCIVWNLILKGQLKHKEQQIHTNGLKSSTESYNCRTEARKNLIVSDSLYDSSPTLTPFDGTHRLKSVAV